MDAALERTTSEDQKIAKLSVIKIKETFLESGSEKKFVEIRLDDKEFLIPKKALLLLFDILKNMAEGKAITLIPSDEEVSTQQAAEMLNISRPHLVKMLEEGRIPFKKVGTHRRIKLINLVEYEKGLKENRTKQLEFLANQAQELNMGY